MRVVIPALVWGDELITKSGCYGELICEAGGWSSKAWPCLPAS